MNTVNGASPTARSCLITLTQMVNTKLVCLAGSRYTLILRRLHAKPAHPSGVNTREIHAERMTHSHCFVPPWLVRGVEGRTGFRLVGSCYVEFAFENKVS